MDKDWYQDIVDFHEKVMQDNFPKKPYIPDFSKKHLRQKLIQEEIEELFAAIKNEDLVGIADGIVDSIVVLLGTAVTYGIDIRPIWNEVVKSNLLKTSGPTRSNGKKLKPEGWEPPNIARLIKEQIDGRGR